MNNRLILHDILKRLVETPNVYFQPPASHIMSYPCVNYSIKEGDGKYADNKVYRYTNRYDVIFIYKTPQVDLIEKVLEEFQMCSLNRAYVANNLYHYVFSLYF